MPATRSGSCERASRPSPRSALPASPDVVAHVLLAGLIELAMVVARAERRRADLAESRTALSASIGSMLD